jgi:hypothetical protein
VAEPSASGSASVERGAAPSSPTACGGR